MMIYMKRMLLCGLLCASLVTAACGTEKAAAPEAPTVTATAKAPTFDKTPIQDYYATFETSEGTFKIRLYGSKAPITVKNFLSLADGGFYKDAVFHRVIDGFMIQGGDPTGTGAGGPGYEIPDEFTADLHFDKPGILAMANRGPNTGGSQFFITLAPTPWLDNKHTIFGTVVQGMDVIEKIGKVKTDAKDKPVMPVVIRAVTTEAIADGK